MNISGLMSRGVEVIDPNATTRDAAIRMRDEDVGALPVDEDDRLAVADLAQAGITEHPMKEVSEPSRQARS